MNFLAFLMSLFIQSNGWPANKLFDKSNENEVVEFQDDTILKNQDSLNFILFFKEIIEDETFRNKSFETCDSELKNIFGKRLNQLEEAIVYRSEITNSDSVVSVLFYDDSLKFYKAKFIQNGADWCLKSLEKDKHPEIPVLKDLKSHQKWIKYTPGCIDKKFIAIFDSYGEADTSYDGNAVLTYAFSNAFLFYNDNRKLPSDFRYEILGLGSGVGGYALYQNNCLFRYWDASN